MVDSILFHATDWPKKDEGSTEREEAKKDGRLIYIDGQLVQVEQAPETEKTTSEENAKPSERGSRVVNRPTTWNVSSVVVISSIYVVSYCATSFIYVIITKEV